jgi:hypothetical protein
MCGGVNISYPFYLADYGYSYSCGYTDLMISCQGEGPTRTPVISLGGENYAVHNILYDIYTIILVDSDVLVGGNCPVVGHEVGFNQTWLLNTSSDDNLTFFFGCYSRQRDPALSELDAYKIKCAGSNIRPGADSFVVIPDELDKFRYLEQELITNCSNVLTVPVRGDGLMAASKQSNFTSGGYGDVLRRGFELEWSRITEDRCHLCEASNGQCAYSQYREFMGCLCHGGKVGNPYCKPASSNSKSF